jgi:hypothetical protein
VETVNDKAVVFLPWNTIEPEAQQQILNTASMPFVFKHVAVMPDCHYGKGRDSRDGPCDPRCRDPGSRGCRYWLRHDCC